MLDNERNVLTLVIDLQYEKLTKSELYEFLKIQYKHYYNIKRLATGSNIFKKVSIQYLDPFDNITKNA